LLPEARVAAKKQWHPVFAELMRPLVESHYRVEANLPVGDAPRQADFVLVRRTRAGRLPAAGLWSELTTWNVLEFKGPTVSARDEDLDLLVELGLGIHRRLNEERAKQERQKLGPEETSFWYLANHLGRRLRHGWSQRVSGIQQQSQGLWRCTLLGHPIFLVSGIDLPVEEASLPLHLIAQEPTEKEREVAQLVAGRPELWERYGGWLASFHPVVFEEVRGMAKKKKEPFRIDLKPLVKTMGMQWVIDQLGAKEVVEHLGDKQVVEQMGVKRLLAALTPEQQRELKNLLKD
jgi:hypothetical protein